MCGPSMYQEWKRPISANTICLHCFHQLWSSSLWKLRYVEATGSCAPRKIYYTRKDKFTTIYFATLREYWKVIGLRNYIMTIAGSWKIILRFVKYGILKLLKGRGQNPLQQTDVEPCTIQQPQRAVLGRYLGHCIYRSMSVVRWITRTSVFRSTMLLNLFFPDLHQSECLHSIS